MPAIDWSSLRVEEAFRRLEARPEGLTASEAATRLLRANQHARPERWWALPLGLLLNQFKSPIVLILLFATVASAFLGDWVDAIIILAIVIGSAILSFTQEYQANTAAEALRSQVAPKATVLRDGTQATLPVNQVVPGDVVLLSAGSLIPADGLVIQANDFFVNEAVLTGETFPVEKQPGVLAEGSSLAARTNAVFQGTTVRSGSAQMLITTTGAETAFGQIAKHLALRPPETEFERGIKQLGYLLTEIMFVLVLGIFAVNVLFQKPVLDSLLFSIALAVGLTPQLLPAIININLAKGSQAMAKRGVIVRRLESIENFGSMDILCTDKTGTLTLGVVQLDGALDMLGEASAKVLRYAMLNATFQTGLANPLDEAIGKASGTDTAGYAKVDEIPYDFTRKRLSVVVRAPDAAAPILITKGALENILAVCVAVDAAGGAQPLTPPILNQIHTRYAGWSAQGYRVLGVAAKAVGHQENPYAATDERDLTFMGFLLFFDPPKPGVSETVQALRQLGVTLKVITGDNQLVARHLAEQIGMGKVEIMTGGELNTLRDEALWQRVGGTAIFAEVDPNQKERIILALKKTGHVVGYIGDGINDAPSLHSADVGISVDNAVDVAKAAADLVLLKQDLEVLREGILQGRTTFANTLKYVFMAVSANFGNMFSVACASLFLPYLPMLPKQILLINFLTDLPEMTIAGDNVDAAFVERPHRWDVAFIRRFMLIFGSLSSVFDIATFGWLLLVMRADQASFHTGWFIESVLSAAIVVFAVRTRLPLMKSRPSRAMLIVTAVVSVVALALPYTPLAGILGFTPLPPSYLAGIGIIVALYVLSAEVAKRWFYQQYVN